MKNALLFDMDGVTLDTEPLYSAAEIRLFSEYGVQIPDDDLSLYRGCSENDFYTLSMKKYGIKENREAFIQKGREYVRDEFSNNISYMDGFKSLHNLALSSNFFIGLVTASPRRTVEWISGKINLNYYFTYIISGDDVLNNKPHPEPYLAMMKIANVQPINTVIIEDSDFGISSALSSGAHVIAKRGSIPDNLLQKAHRIVTKLDEITLQLLEDLLRELI